MTDVVIANRSSSTAPSNPIIGAIDTDVHVYVRDGMTSLAPYLPSPWRRKFEMSGTVAGGYVWVPQKYDFPSGDRRPANTWPPEGGPPGSDPKFAQADHLNRYAFNGAILSSLEAGLAGQGFFGVEASSLMCSAYNEVALEDWYGFDKRYRLAMCVSSVDVEGAVAQIKSMGKHPGVAAVYVPLTNIPLGNKYFYPIFAAAQDMDLPIFLHITAAEFTHQGVASAPFGTMENFSERRVAYAFLGPPTLNSLMFNGVFERFPKLKFVFSEFGFSWAVGLIWRMDATWRFARAGTPWVKRPPSEYVSERVRFGTQPMDDASPEDMSKLVSLLGSECLMFSTDYPHWDLDTPAHVFELESAATKHQIFRTNAQETFRW